MLLIAADIGGTKSWLILSEIDKDNKERILHEQVYPSKDFSGIFALLSRFLQDAAVADSLLIDIMCLALPGIVKKGYARLTNLDWELDAIELEAEFNIDKVVFVNDFQAAARGIATLEEKDIIVLNSASASGGKGIGKIKAISVVTGAGTGLGMAWMDNTQEPLQLFSTEGGHCDFAPGNDEQIELLKFLMKDYAHVSYERILSGPGFVQLYRFINPHDTMPETTETPVMAQKINELAGNGNKAAISSIRLFVDIYAAYIGNLALLFKPAGGIYIAGGIAAHILPWMQEKAFLDSYLRKGRMRKLVKQIPVYLVVNKRIGLQGAIQFAIKQLDNKEI